MRCIFSELHFLDYYLLKLFGFFQRKKNNFFRKGRRKNFFHPDVYEKNKVYLEMLKKAFFSTWFSCEKTRQINFFTVTGQVYEMQFWIHFYIIEAVGIILPTICLVKMSYGKFFKNIFNKKVSTVIAWFMEIYKSQKISIIPNCNFQSIELCRYRSMVNHFPERYTFTY